MTFSSLVSVAGVRWFRVVALYLVLSPVIVNVWANSGTGAGQVHVFMINGGGRPQINFQSHLLHVEQLYSVLIERGVPANQITILSADGSNPGLDLAVRELQSERNFWLLSGTRLEKPFKTRVEYENSRLDGSSLRPATQRSLRHWFRTAAPLLKPGDTLLFYVTDHGTKDKEDPLDNKITLWGKGEDLTVRELRVLMATLDPGVRVVTLMSQCFSGAFADLMYARSQNDLPAGKITGFFSSTADRPAYGCYPENRDKDNVGHSFRFIEALRSSESLTEAHNRVLVSDRTPDVPLKTSDLYLERLLKSKAKQSGQDFREFVDELLRRAWRNKAVWEPEIRQLDRIGESFGYFSPRFLSELDVQSELSEVGKELGSYRDAWTLALSSLNRENLNRFLLENPDRSLVLGKASLDALSATDRRQLAHELVYELAEFARSTQGLEDRMNLLRSKAEATRGAAYRMEVREGAVLRMRIALLSIAGRVYLGRFGTVAQRQAHEALIEGESFTLPGSAGDTLDHRAAPKPFPSYDEDLRLAEESLPGWMGIRFKALSEDLRSRFGFAPGAVLVTGVFPDSPAEEAALTQGDIILGPPDQFFSESAQIREWVMTAPIGKPQRLVVQRRNEQLEVSLVPADYPRRWPKLPGPPQVGDVAPSLSSLQPFRGSLQLAKGGPYLLFFWATWCGPCKAALPELRAFESERGIPVVAVTDEPAEKLETFFQNYSGPFPEIVTLDALRTSFVSFGVSGTPRFVLVDGDARVKPAGHGRPDRRHPAIRELLAAR
jgi:thiol-disulfide isomerase/thioredoxin